MTLKVLQFEWQQALKAHDNIRRDVLSSLIEAVKKAAIDKNCRDNITEDFCNTVLFKEKKVLQEMIAACPSSRQDLLRQYSEKYLIMCEYVPELLTDREVITKKIHLLLENANIKSSIKNKGKIMKTLVPQVKGKVDMRVFNECIDAILTASSA